MSHQTLRLLRNILLRSFCVGLAITGVLVLVTISSWNTWMSWATQWFHTDSYTLTPIVLQFFVDIRFLLLYLLLTPALAIHWTLKKEAAAS